MTLKIDLMDKNNKNNQNKQEMGSDKTPNSDSPAQDDSSHATNEDLEGITRVIS